MRLPTKGGGKGHDGDGRGGRPRTGPPGGRAAGGTGPRGRKVHHEDGPGAAWSAPGRHRHRQVTSSGQTGGMPNRAGTWAARERDGPVRDMSKTLSFYKKIVKSLVEGGTKRDKGYCSKLP
ncbi:hypothetical protein GCM10009665_64030 [Kitasatospora nipponensis]|uniref:Uncharacterized protein n=1 Tax=Kitasatospora nipponensis TaxID=258049 RepID=A0ABN1WUA4_9ACTN